MISLSPNFSVLVSPRSNRPPWKFFVCDCVLFFFLCSLREAGNLVLCGMNSNKKDERNFSLEPNYMFRIIVSWILFSITILLCAVYFCGLKIQRSLILFLSFFYFTFILFYFSFPLFLKMDNRTVHKEKRWTKRRVLVLTKEIDAINITTMIFFYLFIYFSRSPTIIFRLPYSPPGSPPPCIRLPFFFATGSAIYLQYIV